MERIIKRIEMEALFNTYVEFIEKTRLFGGTSYYANVIIKGAKCEVFHFGANSNKVDEYVGELMSYFYNLFAIADSKFTDWSALSMDDKQKFREWLYSDTLEKMFKWFYGGWKLKYTETGDGFRLFANYDQFVLECDKQMCIFKVKDTYHPQENNCTIQLKRNEGIYFLVYIKLLFVSELLGMHEYRAKVDRVPESNLGCLNMLITRHFFDDHVIFPNSRILNSEGIDVRL